MKNKTLTLLGSAALLAVVLTGCSSHDTAPVKPSHATSAVAKPSQAPTAQSTPTSDATASKDFSKAMNSGEVVTLDASGKATTADGYAIYCPAGTATAKTFTNSKGKTVDSACEAASDSDLDAAIANQDSK
ncbi:hypothetical protein [Curtobacterium flaccumfaciens]|uniref:hypothetical protein n=1 Tax=Curtobacterium flaccumfaciens TaxID=2035 RepID=UPI003879E263